MSQGIFSKSAIIDLYGQPSAVAAPPINTGRLYYNSTVNAFHLSPQLAPFANNAAAIAGGLVAGDLYRTGGDPDTVCIVH